MSDYVPTPSIPTTPLPVQECADLSPILPQSSTPFSSSTLTASDRFEYPFPILEPLLSIQVSQALLHPTSPSTEALTGGSIVPPNGTGRGMDMSSFASFSPPVPTAALPYPSATASASQVLDMAQVDALPVSSSSPCVYDHRRRYSAGQLCMLASANSPMPPSLALKRRGWLLSQELLERKSRLAIMDGGPGTEIGAIPIV